MSTTPMMQDTTARLAVTLARVADEAQDARFRAGWIARVGGHPEWWQDRATRYTAAAQRLQAARERLAA